MCKGLKTSKIKKLRMAIGLVRCLEKSCKSTELKRRSATEIHWNKYEVIIIIIFFLYPR